MKPGHWAASLVLIVGLVACGDDTTEGCPGMEVEIGGRCLPYDGGQDVCIPAAETCNGVDDDCDGSIDEELLTTYYEDADGDTAGNAASTCEACNASDCDASTRWVATSDDCDDACSVCLPSGVEICDGLDNDCSGESDEGVTQTAYVDADGDGAGAGAPETVCMGELADGFSLTDDDCDDGNADVFPAQTRFFDMPIEGAAAGSAFDYNCDGEETLEEVPLCTDNRCSGTVLEPNRSPDCAINRAPCGGERPYWRCSCLPASGCSPSTSDVATRCR